MPDALRVAVIGAGFAGMAAALEVARAGAPVTVFEAARELGGRARRIAHRGIALDNGQHILIGAYHELLRQIDAAEPGLSARALLRMPLRLHTPGHLELAAASLPAPLHLAVGLLRARGLPIAARFRAAGFMLAMKRRRFRLGEDTTVAALLRRHGQDGEAARLLWDPLCTAALNTPPESASAQVFLNVLKASFDGRARDSDLLLPRVDLSALFPEPAAAALERAGGEVRRGAVVSSLAPDRGGWRLTTRDGGGGEFTRVICATAAPAARALISGLPGTAQACARLDGLRHQPIVTVYVQYDCPAPLPEPMLGMSGGLGQWAFDRDALYGQAGLLAVVISAEGAHRDLPHDDLARRVTAELAAAFGLPTAVNWTKVVAERAATFACTAGLARPAAESGAPGLVLAGDYVAGDFPGTLEAAVRSGVASARRVLAHA